MKLLFRVRPARPGRRPRRAVLLGLDALALEPRVVPATTTWVGGAYTDCHLHTSGDPNDWNNPFNWTAGVPGPGDTAVFSASVTETVCNPDGSMSNHQGPWTFLARASTPVRLASLQVDATWGPGLNGQHGEVDAASLTLTGLSQWDSGTIAGPNGAGGLILNQGVLTLGGTGGQVLSRDTLINAGQVIQANSGPLTLDSGPAGGPSATVENLAGSLYELRGDGSLLGTGAAPRAFNNRGTFEKSAGAGVARVGPIGNEVDFNGLNGVVQCLSGTLQLGPGFSTGGTWNVALGAVIDLGGGGNVAHPGTYQGTYTGAGNGLITLRDGRLALGPGGTAFNFYAGLFAWTGGTIEGGTLANLGTLAVGGSTATLSHATLINVNRLDLTGSGSLVLDSAALLNQAGAVVDLQGDVAVVGQGGAPSFHNAGTLTKSGGLGTAMLGGPGASVGFDDAGGTVEVRSGTLTIGDTPDVVSGVLTTGTWNVFPGGTLGFANGSLVGLGPDARVALVGVGSAFPALNTITTSAGSLSLLSGRGFTTLGDLGNGGTIFLDAGSTLTVPGHFGQTASGTLAVVLSGSSAGDSSGRVAVGGPATLAGTLRVSLAAGFRPAPGSVATIVRASNLAGAFGQETGLNLGHGRRLRPVMTPTQLVLQESPVPLATVADYDGDGKTDRGVYGYGRYAIQLSGGGAISAPMGGPQDVPVAGDFDGDGKTDLGVYGYGRYLIQLSSGGTLTQIMGGPLDQPVVGDFDGDGKADFGVYGYGRFAIKLSGGGTLFVALGGPADTPVIGDFDGDGKADVGVYGYGRFAAKLSNGGTIVEPIGGPADVPVVGDFDGDGKSDLGVYGYGRFAVRLSGGGSIALPFGGPLDVPVIGDFDGDGKSDLGVLGYGRLAVRESGGGAFSLPLGGPFDLPLPPPPNAAQLQHAPPSSSRIASTQATDPGPLVVLDPSTAAPGRRAREGTWPS